MSGKAMSFLAVLVMSAAVALAAPQQGGMGGQMGGGQMGGGQMGRHRHGRMNADQRVARMKADLNLTDQQADQVKDLFKSQRRKMRAWRDNHAQPTREEMRAHRRKMMAEMNAGMKKILTGEQFKKWETMRRQRRQRRRRGVSRMPEAPPQN